MATNNIKQGCGALIYCTSTHRYLFLLRNDGKFPNTWGIVGGKVEQNETILQGLEREIKEELGGQIDGAKIIPIEKYTSNNNKFIYHTFLIKVEEEFVPILNHEHTGYCWVPIDLHPTPLHPGVYRTFKFKNIKEKIKVHEKITG
jgi:8-oxo-dGTP pyrophosphatase MutT (NUDIX family)